MKEIAKVEETATMCADIPDGHRRYLIEMGEQKYLIDVPENWKITYGVFSPRADHNQTLRLYESKDKQRACFPGVTAFRDVSLPITRLS